MEVGLFSTGVAFYMSDMETGSNDSVEHLGLEYIATCLRDENVSVTIMHLCNDNDLIDYLSEKVPRLIGFTTTNETFSAVMHYVKLCKKECPDTLIVCGGHLATFSPRRVLEACSSIDLVMRGESEIAFSKLCESLICGNDYYDCPNLAYFRDNTYYETSIIDLIKDLDTLPFPTREEIYLRNSASYAKMCGSRGCYGNCSFCSSFVSRTKKPKWRGRSPNNIFDEIEKLISDHNIKTFDFVDSSFEDPPDPHRKRLWDFANEIRKRDLDIKFNICLRADGWTDADESIVKELEIVGLERIFLGIESGLAEDLKLFNKRASVDDNWSAIQLFGKRRIANMTFGYIMFHPYMSYEKIEKSAEFLYKTGVSHDIRNYFTKLEVYPGTSICEKMAQDGLWQLKNDFSEVHNYHFIEENVGNFARQVHQLLKVNSIFELINIDMRMHSLISRLYRSMIIEGRKPDEELDAQQHYLINTRSKIVEFNYNCFMELLNQFRSTNSIDLNKYTSLLNQYLKERINELRVQQIKFLKHRSNQIIVSVNPTGT